MGASHCGSTEASGVVGHQPIAPFSSSAVSMATQIEQVAGGGIGQYLPPLDCRSREEFVKSSESVAAWRQLDTPSVLVPWHFEAGHGRLVEELRAPEDDVVAEHGRDLVQQQWVPGQPHPARRDALRDRRPVCACTVVVRA